MDESQEIAAGAARSGSSGASQHKPYLETLPAKSVSQPFNERTSDYHFDEEVNFVDADIKPEKNIAYELVRNDGTVVEGKTASSGSTELQKSGSFDSYTIRYKGELP